MGRTSSWQSLKIGIVFDDSLDKPDGVQQYVLGIGAWLSLQGHEVHYLVGQTIRTDLPNLHSLSRNIDVRFNGNQLSIPMPTSRRRLRALLAAENFDVLHVQMPYSPWLAQRLIMAAPAHCAVFGTFHIVAYSQLVRFASRVLAMWTRPSQRRFSEIVSVSSAAAEYAADTYGIKTAVLPNVVNYQRFASAAPLLPHNPKLTRILFLGRLVERKGCRYLLEAAQQLQAGGLSGFEIVVCGKGPLRESLEQYAQRYDLPVTFEGFVSEADKPGYYASADIAVFPSTGGESFGIVLIEAMANGRTAVLAASNSGYASVLQPRSELLFQTRSSTALAARLRQYIDNPAKRKAASDWGKTYSQLFDTAVVGEELVAKYRQGLSSLHQSQQKDIL